MYYFYLDLKDTFVVPSFRRNLVLVSYLDKLGYLCSFGNNVFRLSFNSDIVGTGSLLVNDNLYLLDTVASYGESYCMVLSIELIIQIQEHYGIST